MVLRFAGHFVKNFLRLLSFLNGTDKITTDPNSSGTKWFAPSRVQLYCRKNKNRKKGEKELKPEIEISRETLTLNKMIVTIIEKKEEK